MKRCLNLALLQVLFYCVESVPNMEHNTYRQSCCVVSLQPNSMVLHEPASNGCKRFQHDCPPQKVDLTLGPLSLRSNHKWYGVLQSVLLHVHCMNDYDMISLWKTVCHHGLRLECCF